MSYKLAFGVLIKSVHIYNKLGSHVNLFYTCYMFAWLLKNINIKVSKYNVDLLNVRSFEIYNLKPLKIYAYCNRNPQPLSD